MKAQIEITCFAALRKFFKPNFKIQCQLPATYQWLVEQLKELNPEASELLDVCRIAVNEEFISSNDMKITGEPVFLIPPSSGG